MQFFIDHIADIQPISAESVSALTEISEVQSFKKGEFVQQAGSVCRTIYFVKSGILRIFYYKKALEVTESFEFENTFVARIRSLFSGNPSRKSIEALENTELIAINAIKLFELYDQHPDLERLFRKVMEQGYVKTITRIESLQFQTASERYNELIRENPDIILRVPLKVIASFLGITPESLSRIRGQK